MTSNPANGSTRYGVVTCGKTAPAPLDLGPCRLEPGHDNPCRFAALGGYVTVTDGPALPDVQLLLEQARQYRDRRRRAFRVLFVCVLVNLASAAYNVFHLFTR